MSEKATWGVQSAEEQIVEGSTPGSFVSVEELNEAVEAAIDVQPLGVQVEGRSVRLRGGVTVLLERTYEAGETLFKVPIGKPPEAARPSAKIREAQVAELKVLNDGTVICENSLSEGLTLNLDGVTWSI